MIFITRLTLKYSINIYYFINLDSILKLRIIKSSLTTNNLKESMSKIAIITSDNRDLKFNNKKNTYVELSALINLNYAIKNRCDFFFFKIIDDFNNKYLEKKEALTSYSTLARSCKTASWVKLLTIYSTLSLKYEYIIYLDSDCIFNNQKITLNQIIRLLKKKQMLFYSDKPWNMNLPNCGFILIRNSYFNKNFIKKWWKTFSFKNLTHPYEQFWLQRFWLNNQEFVKKKFLLLPDEICRLKDKKQFIFHMTSDFAKNRDYFFNNYMHINKLNISFLKKKIRSKIIFFKPKTIDAQISKRLLKYSDYFIIMMTLLYMIIKNLLFKRIKILIKKYFL